MKFIKKIIRLRENERIVKVVRHPLIVILPNLIIGFLILLLNFFVMFYLFMQGIWGIVIFFAILVVVAFYLLRLVFLWKRNLFIITNRRVVDIEQRGFLEQHVLEFSYDQIKEINSKVKGVFASIFKLGSVRLELKSELSDDKESEQPAKKVFEVFSIKNPHKVQGIINEHLSQKFEGSSSEDVETQGEELDDNDKLNSPEVLFEKISSWEWKEKVRFYKKLKNSLKLEKQQRKQAMIEEGKVV